MIEEYGPPAMDSAIKEELDEWVDKRKKELLA
jgi:trimethylamine:corrinoid methyltransferase-like protein